MEKEVIELIIKYYSGNIEKEDIIKELSISMSELDKLLDKYDKMVGVLKTNTKKA